MERIAGLLNTSLFYSIGVPTEKYTLIGLERITEVVEKIHYDLI